MSAALNSICILRLSALGDVCNAVAAVQAIQVRHPQAKITWIIGRIEHQLVNNLPNVEFISFDKKQGRMARKEFKARFKHRKFDVLLHMQVAMRANRLAGFINATRKIGFDKKRAKELHSLFINERIKAQEQAHVLDGFFGFAEVLNVDLNANKPSWTIPVSESEQAFADQHAPLNRKTLIICPAASKRERCWLPERYACVADAALKEGFSVILAGAPAPLDKELSDQIIALAKGKITNLVGKSSLKEMYALLGNASWVLAPDTGPAHMANAQGTPVLGLYGHSNPARTGPYNFLRYVVEVYHEHLLLQQGKTAQHLPWGKRVKGDAIMQNITSEAVICMMHKLIKQEAL